MLRLLYLTPWICPAFLPHVICRAVWLVSHLLLYFTFCIWWYNNHYPFDGTTLYSLMSFLIYGRPPSQLLDGQCQLVNHHLRRRRKSLRPLPCLRTLQWQRRQAVHHSGPHRRARVHLRLLRHVLRRRLLFFLRSGRLVRQIRTHDAGRFRQVSTLQGRECRSISSPCRGL